MIKTTGDVLLNKLRSERVPLVAFIELTNRCNLSCSHCVDPKKEFHDLSKDLFEKATCELAALGCLKMTLTGGEVLLHKDFFELASYAKKKGFGIQINSNGTLIDKKNIDRLKEIDPALVQVSIYGAAPSTHDSITRVKGSHARALSAVHLFEKHAMRFRIHMMVMRQNFPDLAKLKDAAKRRGWGFSHDFVIHPGRRPSSKALEHRISDAQLRAAAAKGLLDSKKFIESSPMYGIIKNQQALAALSCRISAEGQVFPSGTLRLGIGSLKRNSFRDIWFYSGRANRLRALKESDFECSECKYGGECSWDMGLAFAEHGKVTAAPKEWCRFVRTKKEWE